jgi:hypothetical protein
MQFTIFQSTEPILLDASPDGLWNLLEIILIFAFLAVGVFFFVKYSRGKATAPASVNLFNIGYGFFFIFTGINQLLYMADGIPNFIPALDIFLTDGEISVNLFFVETPLRTQIMFMMVLLIWSVTPVIYAIEKYLKNRPQTPIFKYSMGVGIIFTGIVIYFFVINRYLAPGGFSGTHLVYEGETTTLTGQVINILFIVIALLVILDSLLLIWNFIIFYFIMIIKSTGAMRTKAVLIFLGFLFLYGGLAGGNLLKPDLIGYAILIGPITFIIGMILLVIGFNKKIL